jgi:hypothetical protein
MSYPYAKEFDPGALFEEGREPQNWLKMAIALKHAASRLDWTKKHDEFADWRYVPIYRMLMAFSIENLLKGVWIAEGQEPIIDGILSNRLSSHNLRQYAVGVSGVKITQSEKELLDELQGYLMWAGRYPMPKKAASAIQIRHSAAQHDAEIALGQKLADYLEQCAAGQSVEACLVMLSESDLIAQEPLEDDHPECF